MDYLKFVEELFKRGVISEEIYLKTIKDKKEVKNDSIYYIKYHNSFGVIIYIFCMCSCCYIR